MGYRRTKKKYRLTFEDEDLAGLEVLMGSLSIAEFMELTEASTAAQAAGDTAGNAVTGLLEKFAGSIVSWNLEDEDGSPVPATFDGVKAQELGFVMSVVMAWMDAVAAVDPTSRASANGTGTFPEVSLPMEPLSLSLPN
jgi:hypothetical protein